MTHYEILTATVAALGLGLGVINTLWMLVAGRPRLRLRAREGSALFPAEFLVDNILRNVPDERPGWVAHVELEISNPSRRDNTVLSLDCESPLHLRPLSPSCRITRGTRTADLSHIFGSAHKEEFPIYWPVPSPLWPGLLPQPLDAGRCTVGHLAFEVQTADRLADHLMLRVCARDAHGHKYRKDVCLKRKSTSSLVPGEAAAAAATSETAGSIPPAAPSLKT